MVGWGAALCLRLLTRSLKLRGRAEVRQAHPGLPTSEPFLYALWHDAIIIPIGLKSLYPRAKVAALVSRHQDGSYLAEFMRHVGIRSVRGSTRHGGAIALRELMREAGNGSIFITPDGPRGPRRELKSGIIFLASQTGMPVIPVASGSTRHWRIQGSWTDLLIPKPFSTAYYLLGAPIRVPAELTRDQLEVYRLRVQAEMERLDAEVDRLINGEAPVREYLNAA